MFGFSNRGYAGAVVVGGKDSAGTLCCVHCNRHWVPVKGSGTVRGFCIKCMGPICGSHSCDNCMPFEKKLDLYEKGKLASL